MNGQLNRLSDLEARFERLRIAFQQVQTHLTQALQQIRDTQNSLVPQNTLPGIIFLITSGNALVIAAGGSATGVTVSALSGGTVSTVTTSGVVYNEMQAATVAGKTIIVAPNSDGTYLVITESC